MSLVQGLLGDLHRNALLLLNIAEENALIHDAVACIATFGHFDIHVVDNSVVGGVNANPMTASINLQPGMGSALTNHEAGNIAGGNTQLTAQSEHDVGVVLAHAMPLVQRLLGRGTGVGAHGLINKAMIELVAHAQSLLDWIALLLCQRQIGLHAMGERGLGSGVIKDMVQLAMVDIFAIGDGYAGNTKAEIIVGLSDEAEAHGIAKCVPAFGNRGQGSDGAGQLFDLLCAGRLGQAAQREAMSRHISSKIKLHLIIEF